VKDILVSDWENRARSFYGADQMAWKFRCPACGHVQTVEDFRRYKDRGATPDGAYKNCIGRFMDDSEGTLMNKKSPCDYAIYGLLQLGGYNVILPDGKTVRTFPFADDERTDKDSYQNEGDCS